MTALITNNFCFHPSKQVFPNKGNTAVGIKSINNSTNTTVPELRVVLNINQHKIKTLKVSCKRIHLYERGSTATVAYEFTFLNKQLQI